MPVIPNYRSIHSDLIVHWSGRDIEKPAFDAKEFWFEQSPSLTDTDITYKYVDRLRSILKHGLWMNTEPNLEHSARGEKWKAPSHARTCFSELRLSEARSHAMAYGRLGVGFKRPFLFNRLGCPMTYYSPRWNSNWLLPPLTREASFSACFCKPMGKAGEHSMMDFRYYDEAEWRIAYSEDMEKQLLERKEYRHLSALFVKQADFPKDIIEDLNGKGLEPPEYLIPLNKGDNKWLAVIIFPSLQVKIAAAEDLEIQSLLRNLKPEPDGSVMTRYYQGKGSTSLNTARLEDYNQPILLDLDSCKHL